MGIRFALGPRGLLVLLFVTLSACAHTPAQQAQDKESEDGCKTIFQSIYQPPVVAGQSGRVVQIPIGKECPEGDADE